MLEADCDTFKSLLGIFDSIFLAGTRPGSMVGGILGT